jgi:hypothetical protein
MATSPKSVTIRSYQVGFGDCFLLSFVYDGGSERHVLMDFGSTGLPEDAPKTRMMDIALDIKARTKGKLDAVVATHRHKDHISGFETKKNGKGTGDIIKSLKPKVVVQPWTEDPDIDPEATAPVKQGRAARSHKRVATLAAMQAIAAQALQEAKRSRFLAKPLKDQLSFLGDDNLPNRSAVENLMTMAPNRYVFFGKKSGLERVLPGVTVRVLGPPTVEQTDTIKKQRARDRDEFWHFQAGAMQLSARREERRPALFPKHVLSRGPRFPIDARWLIHHARSTRGEQLLQIVRMLDTAMNNTSVILLFEVGKTRLLFPGDAQIENWQYALSKRELEDVLSGVNVYKVGHHGSLNATPKSLWNLFENRSREENAPTRLVTLMSTMDGKHGSEESSTEVPRRTLVRALTAETDHFSTQSLNRESFFHDTTITFGSTKHGSRRRETADHARSRRAAAKSRHELAIASNADTTQVATATGRRRTPRRSIVDGGNGGGARNTSG